MATVPRTVTLVLVDPSGTVLGALPPFEVDLPYWQEVSDVVPGAYERYGVAVRVLRLLTTERAAPHGGAVTYLAETDLGVAGSDLAALEPVAPEALRLAMADEPLRAPYARLGGPEASVAWARAELGADVVAEQQRTWNLSAIWKLRTGGTTVWLKQVPAFFAHEAAVLAWAGAERPGAVPPLVAAGAHGRMLLEHVDGADLYGAAATERVRIAAAEHDLQRRSVGAADELLAAGVPDRRGRRLGVWMREQLAADLVNHPAARLVETLDERLDAVAACGLPDCLVRGDAHPGNAIGAGDRLVLLDWGDSFVGHPAFDVLRMGVGLDVADEAALVAEWAGWWAAEVPGSDPARAVELLRPVEHLRAAAVYAAFLAQIEPTERVFHADDVQLALDSAVTTS